jgi:hypothetical protein
MRFLHAIVWAGLLVVGGGALGAPVLAQTVALMPADLNVVPRGASTAQPYWQRLQVQLQRQPAAGDTLAVSLPDGVGIADLDGDGRYDDEISLSADSASGYVVSVLSERGRVVLYNPSGGQAGALDLHFPITTPALPSVASTAYGRIDFSNPNERDVPAATLALTYADASDLSLGSWSALWATAAADTSGNDVGDRHPSFAAPAFDVGLPDLLGDGLVVQEGNAVARLVHGPDGNNMSYAFWWSGSDSLAVVDSTTATPALDATTGVPAVGLAGDRAAIAFDTSLLGEGTYFLYLTSDLTSSFPLARSRGVAVRHLPVVLRVGDFVGGDDDYLDSGLWLDFDSGTRGPLSAARDRVDIPFAVEDLDDSAAVFLFYALSDTLASDTSLVSTSGTAPTRIVTGLSGAVFIDTSAVLIEGRHTALAWNVAPNDSDFVAEGDYYVYAVVSDGSKVAIGRSQAAYRVRHSPLLRFDVGRDQQLNTGGPAPERYFNITWNHDFGIDGDRDVDDSADIGLYYSEREDFAVSGGAAALLEAAADSLDGTYALVQGLGEDADGRDDNRYQWDLWTTATAAVPRAGVAQYLYAVVQTDTVQRLLRWDDDRGRPRQLVFSHDPHLRVLAPATALEIDGRRSFRVAWNGRDLDDSAGIWLVLTPTAAAADLGAESTFAALRDDSFADWIAHSPDGSLAAAVALDEDRLSEWAVQPARLRFDLEGRDQPVGNGTYAVYVIIDPAGGAQPVEKSQAFLAPGAITLTGFGEGGASGLVDSGLDILPARRTMTAVGDTAVFVVRPNSAGSEIDLAAIFLSVDTLKVQLVDQDSVAAGVQPFLLDPSLPGLALIDTMQAGADSTTVGRWLLDLVYFEQAGSARFDGDRELARFALVSRETLGDGEIRLEHLDERQSTLYRRGAEVAALAPGPLARYSVERRAKVSGRVPLQGRLDHAAPLTLLLRRDNSVDALDDSLFAAANDADSLRAGIQDTTDSDGRFLLDQVPSGVFHLVAQVDGYIDGQFPALRVVPGEDLDQINPTFAADGRTDLGQLLGGDVTGYVDTVGVASPDNEIDQLDVDFVVGFFGQRITSAHAGLRADVDGDSLIWVNDLNMVAANFSGQGVAPVFKNMAPVVADRPQLYLVDAGAGKWRVEADPGAGLRAYGFRLRLGEWAGGSVEFEGARAFGEAAAVYVEGVGEDGPYGGGALLGPGVRTGTQPLVLAQLRTERPAGERAGRGQIFLDQIELVDGAGRVWHGEGTAVLPQHAALLPNVPNPFNPQTLLPVAMPYAAVAALEIFDAAGQKVRVLHRGRLGGGTHVFSWDGRDAGGRLVGSGAYFARLHFEGGQARRKMLLLR